jgi:hypothetical protein
MPRALRSPGVEVGDDPARGLPGGEALPDFDHHGRLVRVDLQVRATVEVDGPVPIGQAPGPEAAADLALQPATGAGGEVLQVQGRQQGAHAALGRAPRAVGVVAVGHPDHAHPAVLQAAHALDALHLVATEPGQVLDQEDGPGPGLRVGKHAGIAWAIHPAAADGGIAVDLNHGPALSLGPAPAGVLLVFQRRLALFVAAVAAINRAGCQLVLRENPLALAMGRDSGSALSGKG